MDHFVDHVCGHFKEHDSQLPLFEDTVITSLMKAASVAPALANAAVLVAQGCPKRYAEAINALYAANKLPCPDLTVLFDHPKTEPEYHSAVSEVTQEVDDEVESFLRDVEDVEELPASVNEVLDLLTDFDTFEDSTMDHSVANDSLLKIDDHLISIDNESLLKVDEQPISFNSNYYTISTMPNTHLPSSYHEVEDWFDEDILSLHGMSCNIDDESAYFENFPELSPIVNERDLSFSTPKRNLHRFRKTTPLKTRFGALNKSYISPPKRASSSPKNRIKSASTLSLATLTPPHVNRTSNITIAQIPLAETTDEEESFLIISMSETQIDNVLKADM